MYEFYFDMVFYWTISLIFFIIVIISAIGLSKVLIKNKIIIFLGILIYYLAISKAYDIGWVKPFLEESELSQLEVSEGIGKIHGTAKDDLIYLDNDDRYYFDFALCIPYIDKRSLKDQHLKIWHKGRMVYQLSKNGEIIFNIDKANSNIGIYNILLVPLNYFVIGIGILYFCLFLINFKTKTNMIMS